MSGHTPWKEIKRKALLHEFTLHLESPKLALGGDELDLAQAYLTETEPGAGAACVLDVERGVLSATMQVKAHTAGAAAQGAIDLFYGALAAAGFQVDRPGWQLKLEVDGTTQ
jgi:hypothetical protein